MNEQPSLLLTLWRKFDNFKPMTKIFNWLKKHPFLPFLVIITLFILVRFNDFIFFIFHLNSLYFIGRPY